MSIIFRILVVEDDPEILQSLNEMISNVNKDIEVTCCSNKFDALEMLSAKTVFDLLSLDLTIFDSVESNEKSINFGNEVLQYSRNQANGLPILILTASSAETLVSGFLRSSDRFDIWGEGEKRPTVDFILKRNLPDYSTTITNIYSAIEGLNKIELNRNPSNIQLNESDERLIRIFVKRIDCSRCEISVISEGLSDSRVYKLTTYDSNGKIQRHVIAKTGSHSAIEIENTNYTKYITRLKASVSPRLLETLRYGAMKTSGIFYSLALGYESDFFTVINGDYNHKLFNNLALSTTEWFSTYSQRENTIADIRKLLLSDDKTKELRIKYGLDWISEFESGSVQSNWCLVHGDMHGKNILINAESGEVTIIDYGDIMYGPSSIDPLNLEFSFIFHPNGPNLENWPTIEQAEQWYNEDIYFVNCPNNVLPKLRDWLRKVRVGDRDIAASGYSYFMRQLKYEDTNKDLALAFIRGAKALYDQT